MRFADLILRRIVQRGERGVKQGQRVLVLDGNVIEAAVVDAWTQGAVLLLNKKKPSPHRTKGE